MKEKRWWGKVSALVTVWPPNHKSQIASDLNSRSPDRKNFSQITAVCHTAQIAHSIVRFVIWTSVQVGTRIATPIYCTTSQYIELFWKGSHCLKSLVICDSRFASQIVIALRPERPFTGVSGLSRPEIPKKSPKSLPAPPSPESQKGLVKSLEKARWTFRPPKKIFSPPPPKFPTNNLPAPRPPNPSHLETPPPPGIFHKKLPHPLPAPCTPPSPPPSRKN